MESDWFLASFGKELGTLANFFFVPGYNSVSISGEKTIAKPAGESHTTKPSREQLDVKSWDSALIELGRYENNTQLLFIFVYFQF